MLRFLAPYMLPALALAMLAGGLYGASVIDAAGVYGIAIVALAISGVGLVRWDFHKYPDERR
jgi:hypothetical protein